MSVLFREIFMAMRMRIVTTLVCLAITATVSAQTWRPPSDSARCPSQWGALDERGAGNLKSPESVLRAAQLIRTGEVVELAHVLSADQPMNASRQFDVHTKRTVMNPLSHSGSGPRPWWFSAPCAALPVRAA